MTDDRLKILLSFVKFGLGTIALGLITISINRAIQYREIEIKEQDQIGQFLEHALDKDVGVRQRFAQYFATVTRSEVLRERWKKYSKIINKEYNEKEEELQKQEELLETSDLTTSDRSQILAVIDKLDHELNPIPLPTKASAKIYFHIREGAQHEEIAKKIKTALEASSYIVPEIDTLPIGPNNTQIRYFQKNDEEEAKYILSLVEKLDIGVTLKDIELKYFPAYESSPWIRARQYELWFAKSAWEKKK